MSVRDYLSKLREKWDAARNAKNPSTAKALVFSNIIPIIFFVVGIFHLDDCPIEPRIPIWLVVLGILMVLMFIRQPIAYFLTRRRANTIPVTVSDRTDVQYQIPKCLTFFEIIAVILTIAWFITGTYWVLGGWKSRSGCNSLTYYTAFIAVCFWICLKIFLITSCICCFSIHFLSNICYKDTANEEPHQNIKISNLAN